MEVISYGETSLTFEVCPNLHAAQNISPSPSPPSALSLSLKLATLCCPKLGATYRKLIDFGEMPRIQKDLGLKMPCFTTVQKAFQRLKTRLWRILQPVDSFFVKRIRALDPTLGLLLCWPLLRILVGMEEQEEMFWREEKKPVGIWIRVSTEDQARGESPEHHEKRARLYAEAKGRRTVPVTVALHLAPLSAES